MKNLIVFAVLCFTASVRAQCTVTTVSGTQAPQNFCSGDLIFEDNFDSLDHSKWVHEVTMAGGGNYEFQWYVNDRANSFTTGGNLHLKPTFTSDLFGEDFLTSGRVIIPPSECSDGSNYGCERTGTPENIINPIRSALVTTYNSFSFKFGTLEIRAKLPLGDWLWPALWLMPTRSVYGGWPRSGEIDLMESRGNYDLWDGNTHVGVEQFGSTMHFGPQWDINGWPTAHYSRNQNPGFDSNFHVYKMVWTPDYIQFLVDNSVVGTVNAGSGFWDRGGFSWSGMANPWADASNMAPFDQEFFIILNNAVGGTAYFPDHFVNRNGGKPWANNSPRAMTDFWNGRNQWESTWNRHGSEQSHLQVDYVRVYAL